MAWQKANPDKLKANQARYRDRNGEKERARHTKYQSENRGKILAYQKEWRAKNRVAIKLADATWRKLNPEKNRIKAHNRRARIRDNGGKLSPNLAAKLYRLQRGKCACCGLPLGDDYHLDHIMPVVLGGENVDANIQLLRDVCNLQKHAKHPVEFMRSRGFLL